MPFMPKGHHGQCTDSVGQGPSQIDGSIYQQQYATVIGKSLILGFLFG